MSKRDDKPDGFWHEDGQHGVPRGWAKGRPGKAPRGRKDGGSPRGGFGRSLFRAGPTRGHSRTGHDRRGGWFFRGPQLVFLFVLVNTMKCQDCGEFYRYPSKGN